MTDADGKGFSQSHQLLRLDMVDDELVEVTPTALRLRKYFLTDLDRRRNRNHDWTRSA